MNKYSKISLLLLLILILSGCNTSSNSQIKIFDDNKRLAESGDTYTFSSNTGHISDSKANLKYAGFSGVYTIWKINSDGDVGTNMKVNVATKKGDFKIIHVTPDNIVNSIVLEIDDKQQFESLHLSKGDHFIKVVGKNTSGSVDLEIELKKGLLVIPQGDPSSK
ncbi:hypothetical protein [Paenibacillus glacialis]|uniref:Lipoprotein n=1 Tax=Paenibacillus glacialis TaxID=494026 RepID=A0A168MZF3_9BACL|nr:hypothetical protein [Paenibacillus glacialis]OAB45221.1 hypothetical protein PGLA_02870 [Paenibacillus glacialis]